MMSKKLVFICLVIILVCLNWFEHLAAQDMSNLSEAEKSALVEKFSSRPAPPPKSDSYRTPVIFETDTSNLFRGPDSLREFEYDSLADSVVPMETEQVSFEQLRPFGIELFGGPREAMPPDDIATASDYILGPGDNLIVALWGQTEKEYQLTIDREGRVGISHNTLDMAYAYVLPGGEVVVAERVE